MLAAEVASLVENVSVDVCAPLAEVNVSDAGAKLHDASAGNVPQAKLTPPV